MGETQPLPSAPTWLEGASPLLREFSDSLRRAGTGSRGREALQDRVQRPAVPPQSLSRARSAVSSRGREPSQAPCLFLWKDGSGISSGMGKVDATCPKKGRVGLASGGGENRELPQDSGLVTITHGRFPPQP